MKELVLNPTENFFPVLNENFHLKGLYIPQEPRDEDSRVVFGGRNKYAEKIQNIYRQWNSRLNSNDITLALLSGLHASIILFMSLEHTYFHKKRVMILPESAGGHYATDAILKRLGYEVEFFCTDDKRHNIDVPYSIEKANSYKPDYVFIARSNFMQYDNFSWLSRIQSNPLKIFDASQCLTGIILNKYRSPFDMGFDIVLASLHKDFPGTQQALCAFSSSMKDSRISTTILKEFKKYISNIHPMEVFNSIFYLNNLEKLIEYENVKIANTQALYNELIGKGMDTEDKTFDETATQQLWLKCASAADAYNLFKNLEASGILVNYIKLPYNIGIGLRIGTGAATLQGLVPELCKELAGYIAEFASCPSSQECQKLTNRVQMFLNSFIKE